MPKGLPTPPLVGGNSQRDTILQGWVFQSGIHKPEHSNILSYKYPQYYMTSLLDRLGASEGIGQDTWSWNILDRTRQAATQVGAGSISTVTATVTTSTPTSSGYFVVGDVLLSETMRPGRVTAVADNAGSIQLTIVSEDGANWTANEVAANKKWGHAYNSFGEASDAPKGRLYLPTEEFNYLSILRRSFSISGSEFTNRTYIGDGSAWYFTQEEIEMKEFARDRENLLIFGSQVASGSNPGRKSTRGLLQYILAQNGGGVVNNYARTTGITEADLQEHVRSLLIQGSSNVMTVLCGSNAMMDIQNALKDYALDGALGYGSFGANVAGLDFMSYKFMGKTLNFVYYELFDDMAVVPTPSVAPTSGNGVIDFSHFTLWLDMGTDASGKKLISLKHKELDGASRKFIHTHETGMMGPNGVSNGMVSNGKDAFTIHMLSEIGIECRLPNRHGVLKANS